MSFLRELFRIERKESVVLIDVGASRISAAVARYVGSEIPLIIYSRVIAIESRPGEDPTTAMVRTFEEVITALRDEGRAALVRAASAQHVDAVLVSIDAPWQETAIYKEETVRERDFTVTKALVAEALKNATLPKEGVVYTDASVVGTFLNGYAVREPYGHRAHHARVLVLTSRMPEPLHQMLRRGVRSLTRTHRVAFIGGASLRYQTMRIAFAHELNALILDATGPLPEVALMRNGFLVMVSETPEDPLGAGVTAATLTQRFSEIAAEHPLPRTVFLLARFDQVEQMKEVFNTITYAPLWLSSNPPRLLELTTKHMNGLVRYLGAVTPDLPLLLMALYYRYLERPL